MRVVVIDSSVAIKWFVAEPLATESQRLLSHYQTGALSFLAPDLICAEVGNIVWKKQRFQGLAAADAQAIIDGFRSLSIQLTSTIDLLDAAYQLAVQHGRSVYDALYLALSAREHCQFVTADEKLVNAIGASFPEMIRVDNWS